MTVFNFGFNLIFESSEVFDFIPINVALYLV